MAKTKKRMIKQISKKTQNPLNQKTYSLAIIAFVLSLIFFIPFLPLIGLILGIISLVKISKSNKKLSGKAFAISAIIIGIFMLVIYLILFYLFISFFAILDLSLTNPDLAIQNCIAKQGIIKDTCIFTIVSVNFNQTQVLPQDICEANIGDTDIKNMCSAILKKDPSFCEKITDDNSRKGCLDLLAESQNSLE